MSERYPPGIDVETLGRSVPVSAGEAALLLRVRYAPGSHIPPHTDPGTGVWVVEGGTIGFAVQEGEAQITRAGSSAVERIGAGSEVILRQGDTASYGSGNVHTSRNAGESEASILIGGVYADEQDRVRPAAGQPSR